MGLYPSENSTRFLSHTTVHSYLAYIWLDVDGHFVPNISFGVPIVASLHASHRSAFLDCHLMVSRPEVWVDAFAVGGASIMEVL